MVASGFRLQELTQYLAHKFGRAIALATLGLLATTKPGFSAEEIIINYGFFERTISVEELVAFANGEGLSPQLSQYARIFGLSDEDLIAIQQVLKQSVDLDFVELSRFLYTTQGEALLETLGEVIQTPTRQSGGLALRAAIILAASDDENGLTLLNFLMKYPTPGIRVDVGKGFEIASTITESLSQTERAIALVQELADTEAQESAENPTENLFGIQQLISTAPYIVTTQPLTLPRRGIEATLYLPQSTSQRLLLPDDIPLIVISHGLGDERASYDYLADYLAGRGFVVATLDHPGSNSDQIADLLAGLSPDVVANREFLNRPGDISELLDAIQQFALQDRIFRRRLNLQNVGVIGQSFGGYTALALAGATFDPQTLASVCDPAIYFNPSLLLQCQATDIATESPPLKDDRVKAILVVNPIGSAIFGESGYAQLEVPVLMMAATADTVAPALPEQIEPFSWLQTQHRYLALVSETTHFSVIATNPNVAPSIPVPIELLGSSPQLAQQYLQTFSLAFFQRHLRQDRRYDAVLTAGYMSEAVEQAPLQPLSFIQELTPETLRDALESRN
ncbi:MAG: alpha/beta fold hydrolase [Leptolyngbya sp. SIO1D8]|nr:alpha/beta fold hydrolase [Leptolyngbya sp. SIO1D8]